MLWIPLNRDRSTNWQPLGAERRYYGHKVVPPAGVIVGLNRKAWRIVEVRDVHPADWSDECRNAWWQETKGEQPAETWDGRPFLLVLQPLPEGKLHQATVTARHRPWYVLPEHYPVCVECGDPYPCLHLDAEADTQAAAEKLDELTTILPGCCWGCREPITRRQKSIRFDGENLLLPGADSAVFHLRQRCWAYAMPYEQRWVAVDPDRRRWRLACPGRIVLHEDGPECTEGTLCPGEDVRHGSWADHRGADWSCLRCKDAVARRVTLQLDPKDSQ